MEFNGAHNRIARLREQVMGRKGSFLADGNPFLRDVALWKAVSFAKDRSRVQRRAAFLRELVGLAALEIPSDWFLAGEHFCTEHSFGFRREDAEKLLPRLRQLGVNDNEIEAVRSTVAAWFDDREFYAVGQDVSGAAENSGGWGNNNSCMVFWARGAQENHSVRDYSKVLKLGYTGLKETVISELNALEFDDKDRPQKENFLRAAVLICEAGELLGTRYAELAESLAGKTDDPLEKRRLNRMATTCRQVPARGARNLFEATQSLWFAHILTCGEDGIVANSIGRLDQLLNPFYEADLQTGGLSRVEALELMEEFACKMYLDADVQAITLGGVDAKGDDAVNAMSHLILEATENLGFIRDISARLSPKTPDDFIERCAGMIAKGGGIPFFFNDECFVKALNDRGIAIEHARDYAPIGCVELTIPGKAYPRAVSGYFNSLKCLELALFGGVEPKSGKQIGPKTSSLESMKSYDEFFQAYLAQLEHFAKRMVYLCNRGELAQREKGPLPCWSLLTDDCVKRGRDITDGGAIYNFHSIAFVGAADTADSLMALRRMLFDGGKVKAPELLAALKANFAGHENLRQALLAEPKYGNDNDEVDLIARDICERFIALMDRMESPLGGRYFVHLFSFIVNLIFGEVTGATPDGRLAGEPTAYSLSAHQGRDRNGVAAMLKSLSRMPHNQAAGASAAIVDLTPDLVQGEQGRKRLVSIIKAAMAMGVGQLQMNVVTTERLRQAKADPLHYGNIPVRVAGYSQLFNLLSDPLQDHVIARTKHER